MKNILEKYKENTINKFKVKNLEPTSANRTSKITTGMEGNKNKELAETVR